MGVRLSERIVIALESHVKATRSLDLQSSNKALPSLESYCRPLTLLLDPGKMPVYK